MISTIVVMTLELLLPVTAPAPAGQVAPQSGGQDRGADVAASQAMPNSAQLDEARAFKDHPFVLGQWKVLDANRPLMRCVQISSGSVTDLETGEVTRLSRISNRCSFPIRFIGEVGKVDGSGTVCVPELRAIATLPPHQALDIPQIEVGNCFRDIEDLSVASGTN